MACREELWMAEADRPRPPGVAARTAQGRLAVRLQLRSQQPHAAAETDRAWTTGKAHGAERVKATGESKAALQNSSKAA